MKKTILQGLIAGLIAITVIGCSQTINPTVINKANAEVDISKIAHTHNFIGYDILACKAENITHARIICQYVIASKYDKTMYTVIEVYDWGCKGVAIEKTPMYTPEGTIRVYNGEDLTDEFA